MKLKYTLIASFIFISGFLVEAQESSKPSFHMDLVLKEGFASFSRTVARNIRFSAGTKRLGTKGLLIIEFKNSVNEGVSSRVLTYLDEYVDANIKEVLPMLTDLWVESDSPYTAYIAIAYNSDYYYYSTLAEYVEEMPDNFSSNMSAMTNVIGVNSINMTPAQGKKDPKILEEYEGLKTNFYKNTTKGKSKKAYELVNKLIALNPFNKDFIQARIKLEKELELADYKKFDMALIQALPSMKIVLN